MFVILKNCCTFKEQSAAQFRQIVREGADLSMLLNFVKCCTDFSNVHNFSEIQREWYQLSRVFENSLSNPEKRWWFFGNLKIRRNWLQISEKIRYSNFFINKLCLWGEVHELRSRGAPDFHLRLLCVLHRELFGFGCEVVVGPNLSERFSRYFFLANTGKPVRDLFVLVLPTCPSNVCKF